MVRTLAAGRYAVMFSGGKDSMLALDRAVHAGAAAPTLLTLYDAASERVRFHGVPLAVMRAQAEALGLSARHYPTTPATFEAVFLAALAALHDDGISGVIFGDIHLADVRAWYEERVRAAGLAHVEPLWGEAPGALVREAVARGHRALITCVEEATAEPAWLGRVIDERLIDEFEQRGIDPCGERGEYHTLVTDGPLFQRPLAVTLGDVYAEGGFRQVGVQLAP
jgi:diphthine-ammonia ligase